MNRWGLFVHRRRLLVLAGSLLAGALSVALLTRGGTLATTNSFDFESQRGADALAQALPPASTVDLIVSADHGRITDGDNVAAAESALAPLRTDARVVAVADPLGDGAGAGLVAADRSAVDVQVTLRGTFREAVAEYPAVRAEITAPPGLAVHGTGDIAVSSDSNAISESDLKHSEIYALPAVGILLLLVFGSLVATLLCLGVGVLAILSGLAAVYAISHVTGISAYAINITTLIGLGVAIDYSLFIVSRFREELARGAPTDEALRIAVATAGRAILFSGLTVTVGLGGLLLYRGSFLVSLGIAASVVVCASVFYALTFLAAMLALLGPRVNRLALPFLRPPGHDHDWWRRLAEFVMRRPLVVLVPALGVLLIAASPAAHLQLASSDVNQLPVTAESRVGAEFLADHFSGHRRSAYDVVMVFASSATDPVNIDAAYTESRRLAALNHVDGVTSYVDVLPVGSTVSDYQDLYSQPATRLPAAARTLLQRTTGGHAALLTISSDVDEQSSAATDLVAAIRGADQVPGATVYVTGRPAFDADFNAYMASHTPLAVAVVIVVTLLLLFVLLHSVILPVKAVVMNLLSISAAFGALVWGVQQGHLGAALGFQASDIDTTLPPIMFCLIFGLSMDYEVFLLTRVQEIYITTGDNRRAVAAGLQASGRLITGAAAIMVAVFAAFAMGSQFITIKAVGLGIATAVFVDATIVRALVVPAVMRLLGSFNWWAPVWITRRLPDLRVRH